MSFAGAILITTGLALLACMGWFIWLAHFAPCDAQGWRSIEALPVRCLSEFVR